MSLMDAGVPIKKHVAGISIGLMSSKDNYKLLTDIQGPEDHYGDMDFKVAGTEKGITAIQMDVKIDGITSQIFYEALNLAKDARLKILDFMKKIIDKPREKVSPFAPKISQINIPKDKIGELIGPGGRVINSILQTVNNEVTINIEEDGKIYVCGHDEEKINKVLNLIKLTVREYKVGEVVEGTITKILDFGAIVDLGGGQDALIHISEIKDGFVKDINELLKIGDKVKAKVIKVEEGRIGLSLKQL
jgi:polyribonucleotide nucleotidyltransferase